MTSQTFMATDTVDMKKERDWAANIGMMDWDSTNIVFTKRSLVEFLKYTGVTVDTNFMNISKLPKYAKFGKLSGKPAATTEDTVDAVSGTTASTSKTGTDSKPSRRERASPGGPTSGLFEEEFADDALSQAPSAKDAMDGPPQRTEVSANDTSQSFEAKRPSRRVRTAPGGKDSLSGLWGPDELEEPEFKPTRRVRQRPGGQDSVGGLFGA